MKKILLILGFVLSVLTSFAQSQFTGIILYVTDSATYRSSATITNAHAAGKSDIYFNAQATTKHYDWWDGSAYHHGFGSATSGSSTFVGLTDGPGSFSGKTLNYFRVNAGETALEYRTPSQVRSDIGAQATITPGALTKTDDTNVTLTLGGTPATSLLQATSLTLGWTGTLAASRGGTGISSLGTGVATALGINVGSAGAFVTFNGALGTPSSGTLTNATGLPISSGVSGLGSNVATLLSTFSSANLRSALTDESGTGAAIFAGGDLGASTTATTQSAADNSTKVATTAYADAVVAAASETVAGKAELATQSELTTGTDDERIVTPLKLTTWAKYKMVVLSGDDTNNNASANTMEDVGGLSFAVVSGGVYYFRFFVDFTSAATTTGSRWAINGPSTTRLNYSVRFTTTTTSESIQFGNTTYDATTVSGQAPTSGNAWVEGNLTASADGTVVLRFASEVSGSAIVAKAGSILLYARVN